MAELIACRGCGARFVARGARVGRRRHGWCVRCAPNRTVHLIRVDTARAVCGETAEEGHAVVPDPELAAPVVAVNCADCLLAYWGEGEPGGDPPAAGPLG